MTINGVIITSASQIVPGGVEVIGWGIFPGTPTAPETAMVRYDDFSIPSTHAQFNSPQLFFTDPDTGLISDVMTLFLEGFGATNATEFSYVWTQTSKGTH